MPTSITLKNIPDNVYACLRAAAAANRRSLNSEAIVCLEAVLLPSAVSVSERLDRICFMRRRRACARCASSSYQPRS